MKYKKAADTRKWQEDHSPIVNTELIVVLQVMSEKIRNDFYVLFYMTSTEIRISKLIPEKIFPVPAPIQVKETISSSFIAEGEFRIIHFKENGTHTETTTDNKPILLPDPPVSFLRPKKYDYF